MDASSLDLRRDARWELDPLRMKRTGLTIHFLSQPPFLPCFCSLQTNTPASIRGLKHTRTSMTDLRRLRAGDEKAICPSALVVV